MLNVLNFIERKRPAFAGFEVFIEHLVATNMKCPYVLWHWREILCFVHVQPFVLRVVSWFFNGKIAGGRPYLLQRLRDSFEQMFLHIS